MSDSKVIPVVFVGRTPLPDTICIGLRGDSRVEAVRFALPDIAAGQKAYLYLTLPDGGADVVDITDGLMTVTRDQTSVSGVIRAHVEITADGDVVWHSAPVQMTVGATTQGGERIEHQLPTAIQTALAQANAAALRAENATGAAPPVVLTESGTAITVSDSAARPLRSFTLYGRTTQDGTPAPDTPAALTSLAGSGRVTVTAAGRNLAALTPRTETNNGITSSYDAATGTITVTGTATGTAFVSYWLQSHIPAGVPLVIGAGNAAADSHIILCAYSASENTFSQVVQLSSANAVKAVTLTHALEYVAIRVETGATADMTLRIGVMVGESAADYAYSLPEAPTAAEIAVPDGLCGVPVASGGNYTDATGRQWIADSIAYDAETGAAKVVRRVARITGESGFGTPYRNAGEAMWRVSPAAVQIPGAGYPAALCSLYTGAGSYAELEGESGYIGVNRLGEMLIRDDALTDAAAVTAMLTGGEFELIYPLAAPIETDLTADELAALAALRSCYPATTVYTDAGAWAQIAYVADTKTYIDAADAATAEETIQLAERVEQMEAGGIYELIEEITPEEDMVIERTQEPDGTPYNFVEVLIRVVKPVGMSLQNAIGGRAQAGALSLTLYVEPDAGTAAQRVYYTGAELYKGRWRRGRTNGWTNAGGLTDMRWVMDEMFTSDAAGNRDARITKIYTTSAVPAGLTLQIWGVR